MGLNFPSAPIVGQVYPTPALPGVPQWTWNGVSWKCGTIDTANYVRKSGDTMTGALLVPDPTADTQVVSRRYSDLMITGNLLINGFMDVSQEWAPGSNQTAAGLYISDQWGSNFSGAAFSTSNGNLASFGIDRYIGIVSPAGYVGATTHTAYFNQPIEGLRWSKLQWGTAGGIPVSLGFWVYSNGGGVMSVAMRNWTASNRAYVIPISVPAATWVYRTATFPPCPDGTWTVDNTGSACLFMSFINNASLTAAAANSWQSANVIVAPTATNMFTAGSQGCYIAGVTLVPGNMPVPQDRASLFRRPYNDELFACSRYWQWNKYGEIGHGLSAAVMNFTHTPLLPYRVAPSLSCLSTIYTETSPWSVANTVTAATVNGGHSNASGADYQISGTFQNAAAQNFMVGIYQQAVKFNARM